LLRLLRRVDADLFHPQDVDALKQGVNQPRFSSRPAECQTDGSAVPGAVCCIRNVAGGVPFLGRAVTQTPVIMAESRRSDAAAVLEALDAG
jgi:hypothetical protein